MTAGTSQIAHTHPTAHRKHANTRTHTQLHARHPPAHPTRAHTARCAQRHTHSGSGSEAYSRFTSELRLGGIAPVNWLPSKTSSLRAHTQRHTHRTHVTASHAHRRFQAPHALAAHTHKRHKPARTATHDTLTHSTTHTNAHSAVPSTQCERAGRRHTHGRARTGSEESHARMHAQPCKQAKHTHTEGST